MKRFVPVEKVRKNAAYWREQINQAEQRAMVKGAEIGRKEAEARLATRREEASIRLCEALGPMVDAVAHLVMYAQGKQR